MRSQANELMRLAKRMMAQRTNINLRKKKIDQKTHQYIAKPADLDQISRYVSNYADVVNQKLVPVIRELIS